MSRLAVALLRVVFVVGVTAPGCATAPRVPAYCAELRGAGPRSDALDPDATGSVRLEFEGSTIRFRVRTSPNLGKVVATHLHEGSEGVNGPMVHELNPGFTGESFEGSTVVPPALVSAVLANPSAYYFKLHSLKFPGGAIRGQLEPCEGRSEPVR